VHTGGSAAGNAVLDLFLRILVNCSAGIGGRHRAQVPSRSNLVESQPRSIC